jgi:hypothetical protein
MEMSLFKGLPQHEESEAQQSIMVVACQYGDQRKIRQDRRETFAAMRTRAGSSQNNPLKDKNNLSIKDKMRTVK